MSRPNRVLVVVVLAAAVLAVVAAAVSASRQPVELDPSTADGAVQIYVRAMVEGDAATAAKVLSPSSGCDSDDLAAAFVTDSARVVVLEVSEDGDRAIVEVEITETTGSGPFGMSEFSHEERFSLQREDGGWRITDEPWPLYFCDRG